MVFNIIAGYFCRINFLQFYQFATLHQVVSLTNFERSIHWIVKITKVSQHIKSKVEGRSLKPSKKVPATHEFILHQGYRSTIYTLQFLDAGSHPSYSGGAKIGNSLIYPSNLVLNITLSIGSPSLHSGFFTTCSMYIWNETRNLTLGAWIDISGQ